MLYQQAMSLIALVFTSSILLELVLDLLTDPGVQLKILDPPAEIQTYRQWVDWKLVHVGVNKAPIPNQ